MSSGSVNGSLFGVRSVHFSLSCITNAITVPYSLMSLAQYSRYLRRSLGTRKNRSSLLSWMICCTSCHVCRSYSESGVDSMPRSLSFVKAYCKKSGHSSVCRSDGTLTFQKAVVSFVTLCMFEGDCILLSLLSLVGSIRLGKLPESRYPEMLYRGTKCKAAPGDVVAA